MNSVSKTPERLTQKRMVVYAKTPKSLNSQTNQMPMMQKVSAIILLLPKLLPFPYETNVSSIIYEKVTVEPRYTQNSKNELN